jgi:hypothetical protein
MNQTDLDGGQATTASRRRRAQTARRLRRMNSIGNTANDDLRAWLSPSSSASTSSTSSSPPQSPSVIVSSSDDESPVSFGCYLFWIAKYWQTLWTILELQEGPSEVENKDDANDTTSNRTLRVSKSHWITLFNTRVNDTKSLNMVSFYWCYETHFVVAIYNDLNGTSSRCDFFADWMP